MNRTRKMLLVGDNPFQGVSHLTQERARARNEATRAEKAAELLAISLNNGANGFMFSVNETSLSILRILRQSRPAVEFPLYPTVPAAYEYVRLASQHGTPGLITFMARQIWDSRNIQAILLGTRGILTADPSSLFQTYITYELGRIKLAAGKKADIRSLLLHEIVTDMALALDLKWLFQSYISSLSHMGVKPGFETRNFSYTVNKLKQWNIDITRVVIVAPFNRVGFQMSPSRTESENTLSTVLDSEIIAINVLASGYVKLPEAATYIKDLGLSGIAVGVSREEQARQTFRYFNDFLESGK
jgi:hypothetical protein